MTLALTSGPAFAQSEAEISACDATFSQIETLYSGLISAGSADYSELDALRQTGDACASKCRAVLDNPTTFRNRPSWGICEQHRDQNMQRPAWNAI